MAAGPQLLPFWRHLRATAPLLPLLARLLRPGPSRPGHRHLPDGHHGEAALHHHVSQRREPGVTELSVLWTVFRCIPFCSVSRPTYSEFTPEGVLANTLGLLLVGFGVVVAYIVTKEDFRRPLHPEEEALSMHFKTLTEGEGPNSP